MTTTDTTSTRSPGPAGVGLAAAAGSSGCRTEMYDQPRYETFEASDFFDGRPLGPPLVAGTVPRGWAADRRAPLPRDGSTARWPSTFPFEVDEDRSLATAARTTSTPSATPATAASATARG